MGQKLELLKHLQLLFEVSECIVRQVQLLKKLENQEAAFEGTYLVPLSAAHVFEEHTQVGFIMQQHGCCLKFQKVQYRQA